MPYEKPITEVNLTKAEHPKAFEIINLIAEDEDRSGRQVAERLIIESGEPKAFRLKQRKQQAEKEFQK